MQKPENVDSLTNYFQQIVDTPACCSNYGHTFPYKETKLQAKCTLNYGSLQSIQWLQHANSNYLDIANMYSWTADLEITKYMTTINKHEC